MSKTYGYIRVSTLKQKTDRQYEELNKYSNSEKITFDCIFEDRQSGKNFDRPQYNYLKGVAKSGDTIIVKELDRFGRNYEEVKKELEYFYERNIKVIILDTPALNTGDETLSKVVNGIVINVLSYIAQKEREKTINKINEGLSMAKKRGTKLGRPPVSLPKKFFKYYAEHNDGKIKGVEFAKLLEISIPTLYRWIKLYETSKSKTS